MVEGIPKCPAAWLPSEVHGPTVAKALVVLVLAEIHETAFYRFYYSVLNSLLQSQVPRAMVFEALSASG
jgi:hypothetical protein